MKLNRFFSALWNDEQGQSTTEYILMLSVVVMIAMKFKKEFLGQMDGIIGKLGGNINSVVSDSSP